MALQRSPGSPLPFPNALTPAHLGGAEGWFVIPSPSQGSKGDGRCHKRNQWPELKKMALYVSPLLLLRLRCPASEVLVVNAATTSALASSSGSRASRTGICKGGWRF
ncbi:hypothetical protein CEXT_10631 [Caerostris extrusa]|uniref:Uncharacterized protein n=1 Tax=Caerostris extrusa TaxID=172846 RepID=A0AAV4P220_CAEEX|nr:hypothetical protein CEXT_10631 [Caerostris extrusa]